MDGLVAWVKVGKVCLTVLIFSCSHLLSCSRLLSRSRDVLMTSFYRFLAWRGILNQAKPNPRHYTKLCTCTSSDCNYFSKITESGEAFSTRKELKGRFVQISATADLFFAHAPKARINGSTIFMDMNIMEKGNNI